MDIRVNGRLVQSDKPLASVTNSRVEFADGSWVDVSTGDAANKGAGDIRLDGQVVGDTTTSGVGDLGWPDDAPAGNTDSASDTREYGPARTLQLLDLPCDVSVVATDSAKSTISGPADVLDKLTVTDRGGTLTVAGEHVRQSRSVSMVSGGSVTITNGSVTITGDGVSIDNQPRPTVVIAVSPEAKVAVTATGEGRYDIETRGQLHATVQGSGRVRAREVAGLDATVQGSGRVNVDRLTGSAGVTVQGSGRVEVAAADMDFADVTVQGSGRASIRGRARRASLTAMGSARISLDHSDARPHITEMGSARVSVGNW